MRRKKILFLYLFIGEVEFIHITHIDLGLLLLSQTYCLYFFPSTFRNSTVKTRRRLIFFFLNSEGTGFYKSPLGSYWIIYEYREMNEKR